MATDTYVLRTAFREVGGRWNECSIAQRRSLRFGVMGSQSISRTAAEPSHHYNSAGHALRWPLACWSREGDDQLSPERAGSRTGCPSGSYHGAGHVPIRFEDFSALPQPSREACMRAVQESDVYLLILGPHYGHVFPETGQSATHDEFVAAQEKGIPRIVLKKTGVQFDPQREDFIKLVGDYGAGVFWDTFTDATDIQAKVARALKRIQDQPTLLTFISLPGPLATEWRRDWPSNRAGLGLTACLEVHILPVPTPARFVGAGNERVEQWASAISSRQWRSSLGSRVGTRQRIVWSSSDPVAGDAQKVRRGEHGRAMRHPRVYLQTDLAVVHFAQRREAGFGRTRS